MDANECQTVIAAARSSDRGAKRIGDFCADDGSAEYGAGRGSRDQASDPTGRKNCLACSLW
jgi:hypothetical protein